MSDVITNSPVSNTGYGFPVHLDPPPLRIDSDGAVRVGTGRITLDLVVREYENGSSPEGMVQAYDVLSLTEVYGAIAYYLRHRQEVQAYLKRRGDEAEALLHRVQAMQGPQITRAELLARKQALEQAATEQANASAGE